MSKCECCKEENRELITFRGRRICPACYMGYISQVKVCETEIDQLKHQLTEKDKENKQLKSRISELEDQDWYESCIRQLEDQNDRLIQEREEKDKEIESIKQQLEETNAGYDFTYEQSRETIKELKQNQIQLAIQELEKVNGILTDIIIEVTQDEFDLNKLCYLEEISANFYEKIQQQIKELKGEKDGKSKDNKR